MPGATHFLSPKDLKFLIEFKSTGNALRDLRITERNFSTLLFELMLSLNEPYLGSNLSR